MLEYTSCLFATVAVHAFMCDVPKYQFVFQLVTCLSILYRLTNNPWIRVVDMAMAHVAFVFVMLDAPAIVAKGLEWLFVFPAAVLVLWVAEHIFLKWSDLLHAALHVFSAVGANAFILYLHSKCTLAVK